MLQAPATKSHLFLRPIPCLGTILYSVLLIDEGWVIARMKNIQYVPQTWVFNPPLRQLGESIHQAIHSPSQEKDVSTLTRGLPRRSWHAKFILTITSYGESRIRAKL